METRRQKATVRNALRIYEAWNADGEISILEIMEKHPEFSRERIAKAVKWLVKTERLQARVKSGYLTLYQL